MVVVRFAPSPTGPLHIGGVRTALYNYLFARQHNGRFILRIEDTDRTRFVPGAEKYIIESLKWLGIEFNEGVGIGGENGPYRQSERAEEGIYRKYVDQLIADGKAYYAFDTAEELDAMRERLKEEGNHVQQYNHATRMTMKNSFSLPEDEVQQRIHSGDPYVIRMNMPADEDVSFRDVVREEVTFNTSQLDDKVLLKSDGIPTYHLANVVDDHLMEITHIIRGEEWLSSTPLHVLLYRAFGWGDEIPVYVHLPLLLNPNGKGKLSKRHGDKLGFPVFPIDWVDEDGNTTAGFREAGYEPDALVNFLSLLGWSPGNDEEMMGLDRLTELFSLDRITSSGAKFDLEKLVWFNENYIRNRPTEKLLPDVKAALSQAGIDLPDDDFIAGMINLMKERVKFVKEFATEAPYFFTAPATYDEKMHAKQWKETTPELMERMILKLNVVNDWDATNLHEAFQSLLTEAEVGAGRVMAPLRLALTGVAGGPGVFDIAALLGKEETIGRIKKAIEVL